jgi:hypothetical protein
LSYQPLDRCCPDTSLLHLRRARYQKSEMKQPRGEKRGNSPQRISALPAYCIYIYIWHMAEEGGLNGKQIQVAKNQELQNSPSAVSPRAIHLRTPQSQQVGIHHRSMPCAVLLGPLVGGAANGTHLPTARQGTASTGVNVSKGLTSNLVSRWLRPLHMLARLIGHQRVGKGHGLPIRTHVF